MAGGHGLHEIINMTENKYAYGQTNNIRESVDNLDLDGDFAQLKEGFGINNDNNLTLGVGNLTVMPQMIGGGGNDTIIDPNSTVGDLLGEMNRPKNNLAASAKMA